MKDFRQFFKGKKVTVMGLGLLGRGVGDVAALAEWGARVTVTDLKSRRELQDSLEKLRKFNHAKGRAGNIKYVLGKHRLEDFSAKGGSASGGRKPDMILKSAGVPLNSQYIKEAQKNKIPVEMSATLFAKFSGIPMIGVTGTRGKSTVTHLIYHILEEAGKKVILGGNIRGVSNLQLLKRVKGKDIAIFELDSWQLQSFGDSKISPQVAVFTTFFPDHMVYYGQKMKKYFLDKANIFKYQKTGDTLIAGSQAYPFIMKWGGPIKSRIIMAKFKKFKTKLNGEHNVYNIGLAVQVAKVLGIKEEVIKKAVAEFDGVEGRLQFVREVKGVKYYNDTTATTPEATVEALTALGKKKNVILIAGGSDKDLNMNLLIKEIPKYCKGVVLLLGTGTDKIKDKIKYNIEVNSMKSGVLEAKNLAKRGDVVLLSPSFASFGMFNNEYDRGDQFMKIVKNLK